MPESRVDEQQYWSERLARTYSLDGVGWHGLGESYNRSMYWVRRRLFLRTVRAVLPHREALEVLDVGSGTGFYIRLWHELGVKGVTGSDLTQVAVERLRARFPGDQVHQLDITARADRVELGPFDAISAMDVLFHVLDDERYAQALVNLGDLLRPGGTLLLSENLIHGSPVRVEHQVSRSIGWIESRLRDAGLEIVSRRPMFVLMNTPVDSRSPLLQLWWRSLTSGLHRWPRLAPLAGMSLGVAELALTAVVREGPSTELVVCRKVGSGQGSAL